MNKKIKDLVEAIYDKDKETKANRAAKEKALAASREAYAKACADADAAIGADNMTAFRKADNTKKELAQDTEFLEKVIKKIGNGVSAAEVEDTWKRITELYNKDFEEKWKAYEKARRVLALQFNELVLAQNEIFATRDDLATLGNCNLPDAKCIPSRRLSAKKGDPNAFNIPALDYCQDAALIVREYFGMEPVPHIADQTFVDFSAWLFQVLVEHKHFEPDITL